MNSTVVRRVSAMCFALLALTACGSEPTNVKVDVNVQVTDSTKGGGNSQNVTSIVVSGPATVGSGANCAANYAFSASVNNGALTVPLTWSSSNPSVGTINPTTGVFTPTSGASGTTVITAKAANGIVSNSFTVTVSNASCGGGNNNPAVHLVVVSPSTLSLTGGQTGQFMAVVTADQGAPMTVSWQVSDQACATIVSSANNILIVQAASNKTCQVTITASVGGKSGTGTLNVTPGGPTSVTFSGIPTGLQFGPNGCTTQSFTLQPQFQPSGTTAVLTYTSSNSNVATIGSNGQVILAGTGSTVINAYGPSGQLLGTTTLNVASCGGTNPTGPSGVTYPNLDLRFGSCQSSQFSIQAVSVPSGYPITLQVTSMSPGNLVSGFNGTTGTINGTGSFTVQAYYQGAALGSPRTYQVTACQVTGTPTLEVSPATLESELLFGPNGCTSAPIQLQVRYFPNGPAAGGGQDVNALAQYSLSTGGVVTVTNGRVTINNTGSTQIMVSYQGLTRTIPVVVRPCNTNTPITITMNPTSGSRQKGQTMVVTATVSGTGAVQDVFCDSNGPAKVGVTQLTSLSCTLHFNGIAANGDGTAQICMRYRPDRTIAACGLFTTTQAMVMVNGKMIPADEKQGIELQLPAPRGLEGTTIDWRTKASQRTNP